MRILFLAPLPPPVTGAAKACEALLDDLRSTEDVVIVDLMKGHHRQGLTSLRHIGRMLRAAAIVARRASWADRVYLAPSQTIIGNLKDLLLLAALGPHTPKAYVHLNGGGIRQTVYERHRMLAAANRYMLGRVGGAIVLGERLRSVFDGYVPPDRISVVANFAADELYCDEDAIGAKWADPDALHVVFLAILFRSKGWPEVIEAARSLRDVHFTIAGPALSEDQEREVRRLVEDLDNVDYVGPVDDVGRRDLLARAHVLCLPTSYPYEGQPLTILEAYASGCIVVTTDHAGIRDVFTPDVNGFETEAGSAVATTAAIRAVTDDPNRASAIALANRATAEEYRGDRFAARMRDALGLRVPDRSV